LNQLGELGFRGAVHPKFGSQSPYYLAEPHLRKSALREINEHLEQARKRPGEVLEENTGTGKKQKTDTTAARTDAVILAEVAIVGSPNGSESNSSLPTAISVSVPIERPRRAVPVRGKSSANAAAKVISK